MRTVIYFSAISFLLSGCLLGKMEDGMDKTNANIEDSNRIITETRDGMRLSTAIEISLDEKHPKNWRVASTETVFKMAEDDRIGKYIALPGHIRMRTVDKAFNGKTLTLPNVTIIGDEIDPVLGVAPINADLYEIQSFAAKNLLEQMVFNSKLPGLTIEQLDTLRNLAVRMVPVATGILGGAKAEAIKASFVSKVRPFEKSVEERTQASQLISELYRMLSMGEEQIAEARLNIETRLGVGSY